ncbi:Lytic transglycosylase [Tilletia horrida]|nr:Lytic transglycosylase [Tilletia horrida]
MRARSLILLSVTLAISMAIGSSQAAQSVGVAGTAGGASRHLPVQNIPKHQRIISQRAACFSSASNGGDARKPQQRADVKKPSLRKVERAAKHRSADEEQGITGPSPDLALQRKVDYDTDNSGSTDDADCQSDDGEDDSDAEPAHDKHPGTASDKPLRTGHSGKKLKYPQTGRVFSGEGTYYNMAGGITACGGQYTDDDMVAALSGSLFDSSSPGGNPNANALCGKKLRVSYHGKSITVTAVDRCEACAFGDLDFTPTAFSRLASIDTGRIDGIHWRWLH